MSTPSRRPIVAIVGGASPTETSYAAAHETGRQLVDAGYRLATGGLRGVMTAALQGGRESEAWTDGTNIGILPGLNAADANPYVDIAIPTGMNYARNVVLVSTGDVVVAIAGGAGTLSEISMAWQHEKPIVVLDTGEGWGPRLAGEALDHRRDDVLHLARTPAEVVTLVRRLMGTAGVAGGFG
jgi:hypothetical protein